MKLRKVFIGVLVISLFLAAAMSHAAGTLTLQVVTNKVNYAPSKVVTIRATALNGTTRVTSSSITSAKVTVKDPAGKTIVNAVAMSKDSATGLCFYDYTLPSNASKGNWTVSVTITDNTTATGTSSATFKVQLPVPDHTQYVTSYNGTATCISCHSTQANDMFNSLHYQWRGDTSKSIELAGVTDASKIDAINDFCIRPDPGYNWLGNMILSDGTINDKCGCAWCHNGKGLAPSKTSSQAQLENIDCLICHSPTYKRVVKQNTDGTYSMVPDPTINILAAAQNIIRPTKAECLRCHAGSGGGDNRKRGDIEGKLASCDYAYDVHMGTNGQNLSCQECHRVQNHKFAGRGSDMRAIDNPFNLSCESCHTQLPHRSYNTNYKDLDRHTGKVYCTVCHVPTFAKTVATDMFRDWSAPMVLDPVKKFYDPAITFQSNVMPNYAWFDGYSHFYKFKDPVSLDSRNIQKMSWPEGDFVDPSGKFSKLYPFKVHTAMLPMENTTKQLLPTKAKIAFETGDVTAAIVEGARLASMQYTSHSFVKAERYLGIFHGIGPKSTALSCSNQPCHGNENRIPFTSLGYQRRGTTAQLCDVCHSARTYSSFTQLHGYHRDRKNCNACHGTGYPLKEPKTTLCDNCHSMKTFDTPEHIHSIHVQGKGYDCSNCHTFTANMTSGGHREYH